MGWLENIYWTLAGWDKAITSMTQEPAGPAILAAYIILAYSAVFLVGGVLLGHLNVRRGRDGYFHLAEWGSRLLAVMAIPLAFVVIGGGIGLILNLGCAIDADPPGFVRTGISSASACPASMQLWEGPGDRAWLLSFANAYADWVIRAQYILLFILGFAAVIGAGWLVLAVLTLLYVGLQELLYHGFIFGVGLIGWTVETLWSMVRRAFWFGLNFLRRHFPWIERVPIRF